MRQTNAKLRFLTTYLPCLICLTRMIWKVATIHQWYQKDQEIITLMTFCSLPKPGNTILRITTTMMHKTTKKLRWKITLIPSLISGHRHAHLDDKVKKIIKLYYCTLHFEWFNVSPRNIYRFYPQKIFHKTTDRSQ